MFTSENGAVSIPHPEKIKETIKAKTYAYRAEVRNLRKFLAVAYTAHNVTPPAKKAKKAAAPVAPAA